MKINLFNHDRVLADLWSPDNIKRLADGYLRQRRNAGVAGEYLSWLGREAMPQMMQSPRGGSADAAALSLMGAGLTATSPLVGLGLGALSTAAPFFMGAAGGAMIANRLFDELDEPGMLKSDLGIRSATPPIVTGGRGLLIGYTSDGGVPIRIPYEHLMRHFMTGGMTGVGKTVSAIMFMVQQIARGGGVLWVDGKLDPDNILMFYHIAKWMGRETDFRVINPADPQNSNSYNFVLYGDADEVASRILSTVPSTQSSAGADYYKQASNQGLISLISTIKAMGLAYNCMDLAILLTNAKAMMALDKMVETQAPAGHKSIALFRLFLESCKTTNNNTGATTVDVKKLRDTFGGVAGRLFVYGIDKCGEVTSSYTPDVRLFEDIRDNRLIYCALPTMGKQMAAQNFGKIVTGDLRSAIAQIQSLPVSQRPNPPFLVWLDEVASYGSAEALETPFQQARSASVFLGVGFQENSSIEVLGESFLGSIVGNTFSKLFFKPANRETADTWADLIGKHKTIQETMSRSYGGGASAASLRVTPDSTRSENQGIGVSYREQEEYRLSAERLARLDFGQAVLLYGASRVYDVRVPKLDFSPDMRRELGGIQLQRPRSSFNRSVKGLHLFEQYKDFMTELSEMPETRRAKADDNRGAAVAKFSKSGYKQVETGRGRKLEEPSDNDASAI